MKAGEPNKAGNRSKKRRLLPGLAVKDGFTPHPFDLKYGVRTSGLIAGRYLKSGHVHDRHATAYYGVAPSVFQALLARWRRSRPAAPISETTFIDVGAGMGRAMLLASEFPFRAVIGVEFHPELARIARGNVALWRAAGRTQAPTRILCRDAVDLSLPPGPCVAFLFNPFGATVMRRLFANWRKDLAGRAGSRPGRLDILYVNNEQEHVLDQQPDFARVFRGQVRRSRADAIADHTILANYPEGEYASSNYEDCSIYRWLGARVSDRKKII